MILYVYIIISALITALWGTLGGMFTAAYGWWATPLSLIGGTLAFILLHGILLVIMVAAVNLNKPPRDTKLFRIVVGGFLHLVFKLARIEMHITGLEKVPDGERFLLVCNHLHNLDPAPILYALGKYDLAFIAKREVRELYPFVYRALHKMNGLPIDRDNDREGAKTIINAVKLIKNDKNSVAVFPEGFVSLTGELLPFRNGAFKVATKNEAKIVVCTLKGTKGIPKNMFRRHHDVYFDILEVIDTKGNTHTAELGEQIHAIMNENLKKD